MQRIAFVFSQAPHGSSGGREGLDAVLATSALSEEIALFFISDGVLQLTAGQQPQQILARNYVATFGVLPLYDVDRCYLCAAALAERGLSAELPRVLDAEVLPAAELSALLHQYDRVIVF